MQHSGWQHLADSPGQPMGWQTRAWRSIWGHLSGSRLPGRRGTKWHEPWHEFYDGLLALRAPPLRVVTVALALRTDDPFFDRGGGQGLTAPADSLSGQWSVRIG